MGYVCDFEDQQPVRLLITDLQDGTTTALCGEHVAPWVESLHNAFTAAGLTGEQGVQDPAGDAPTSDGAPAEQGGSEPATPAPDAPPTPDGGNPLPADPPVETPGEADAGMPVGDSSPSAAAG